MSKDVMPYLAGIGLGIAGFALAKTFGNRNSSQNSNQSGQLAIEAKLEELGKGAFGEVWKVECSDGQVLAAKYFKSHSVDIQRELRAEQNLFGLRHPNVLRFVAVITEGGKPVLLTEFIDGETLRQVRRRSNFNVDTLRSFIRQICSGLQYLHSPSPVVIHRDLKGDNIMVSRDGTVKLIDFGLSHQLELVTSGQSYRELVYTSYYECGTVCFMAPELLSGHLGEKPRYSTQSDVWALGCTVYELVAGQPPFVRQTREEILGSLGRFGAPDLPGNTAESLRDFYRRCVAMQPGDRSSARQLLEHHFL